MSKAFGDTVREMREACGMSLRALAKAVDVDYTYISKIERDQMDAPADAVILRLAEVLHIWPEGLLNLSAKPPKSWHNLLESNPRLVQILRLLATRRYSDEEYQAIFEIIRDDGYGERSA